VVDGGKMWLSLKDKICLVIIIIFLSGCASLGTYNPATGRNEFIAVSTADELSWGQSLHAKLEKQYTFIHSGPSWQRVQKIGQKISFVSDRQDYQYKFYLIDKDELNAFTTPGGYIYVFTGLIKKLKTDDEIAGVLAHEVGHCAAKHTAKKFQSAMGYDLIGRILLSQLGSNGAKQIASLSSDVISKIVFSAYSRKDEHEADKLGLKYMFLAGFKVQGMVDTLEVLQRESGKVGLPVILRSHPLTQDRVDAVKLEIETVYAKYDS